MALPPVPTPAGVLSPDGRHGPVRRGPRVWQLLAMALAALVVLVSALGVAVVVASETGVTGFLLGTALALLPVPVVVAAFLWVDRNEPEPPGLLLVAFAWGAAVATLVSIVVNSVTLSVIAEAAEDDAGLSATAVYVAPFVEEATKGIGVLAILLLFRREFDGIVDGIVYAGFVGIGFAFTENVLYYGRAYLEADLATPGSGVFAAGSTFLLRGIFSPFAHSMFTIATGIGLGTAAQSRSPLTRLVAPLAGYAVAVALHASWNRSAVAGLGGFISTYVGFMVPVFLGLIVVASGLRRREARLITATLPDYARAGWLPPQDLPMLATPRARRTSRSAARAAGRGREMAAYQDAAVELAFLRARAGSGHRVEDLADRELALLHDLAGARTALARR